MLSRLKMLFPLGVLSLALLSATVTAADAPSYGPQLQGFEYPYPLKQFNFNSQGSTLQMGYMDVAPTGHNNGQTVVLMHGKNFCGATWELTIKSLINKGYRVIAPDQIGFCSSTKPGSYQYSFEQLAINTNNLLKSLNIKKAAIVGHSTGGMLAVRYSLMFPQEVSKLVLVNPIGLEDWKAKGVPYRTVDQWYDRELEVGVQSIHDYELHTYYVGQWKADYDRWVDMLAGLNNGPGRKLVAWNSALIYDMIFTQPVIYEFKDLNVPTTLMIGTSDTTAIGSDLASPEVKAKLGNYSVLGKKAAKMIPNAKLIEFKGLGHAPQIQEPQMFNQALLKVL